MSRKTCCCAIAYITCGFSKCIDILNVKMGKDKQSMSTLLGLSMKESKSMLHGNHLIEIIFIYVNS